MEYTGFTQLGECVLCKEEKMCYEMEDMNGECVLICDICVKNFEGEE